MKVAVFITMCVAASTLAFSEDKTDPPKPPAIDQKILELFRKNGGIPQLTEPYQPGDIGRGGERPLKILRQGSGYIDLGGTKSQTVRLKGFKTAVGVSGQNVSLDEEVIRVSSEATGNAIVIEPFDAAPYVKIVNEEKQRRLLAAINAEAAAAKKKAEQEAAEKAKKEAEKKAAEASPEGREKTARSKLALAKTMQKADIDKAKSRYHEIVKDYAETKAAAEASTILKLLKKEGK